MIITIQDNGYLVQPQNEIEKDTLIHFLKAMSQTPYVPTGAEAAFQASLVLPNILDPKIPLP